MLDDISAAMVIKAFVPVATVTVGAPVNAVKLVEVALLVVVSELDCGVMQTHAEPFHTWVWSVSER